MSLERIIGGLIIAVLLLAFLYQSYTLAKKKRAQKRRFKRGDQLEKEAAVFLKKKGYQVLASQKVFYHTFKSDKTEKKAKLITDYIVKKGRKTYIVEVKSGKSAIKLSDKNTRRQLLEYDFVIPNDGVILLDMENRKLQLVEFAPRQLKSNNGFYKVLIIGACVAILIPSWMVKFTVLGILALAFFWPLGGSRSTSLE
ncbi:MAG: hypothetical protein PF444_06935 [Bacteroidales bacterium]|jgi:Holliday junction resolvase|nr:hypothetical protein [Bacteroidales bacterium]